MKSIWLICYIPTPRMDFRVMQRGSMNKAHPSCVVCRETTLFFWWWLHIPWRLKCNLLLSFCSDIWCFTLREVWANKRLDIDFCTEVNNFHTRNAWNGAYCYTEFDITIFLDEQRKHMSVWQTFCISRFRAKSGQQQNEYSCFIVNLIDLCLHYRLPCTVVGLTNYTHRKLQID